MSSVPAPWQRLSRMTCQRTRAAVWRYPTSGSCKSSGALLMMDTTDLRTAARDLRWDGTKMPEKICPECNGEGVVDQGTEDETRCPTCNGSGVVPDDGQESE